MWNALDKIGSLLTSPLGPLDFYWTIFLWVWVFLWLGILGAVRCSSAAYPPTGSIVLSSCRGRWYVPTDNAMLQYISWLLMSLAGSIYRRLANGGVKKSVRTSVKNGELSEAERNEVERCKFSPFSERVLILARICTAAKRISFGSFSLCNRKENEQPFSYNNSNQ